ncbi:MAG: mRNA interferase RelE/StbE [Candidatus Binatia bacterium]
MKFRIEYLESVVRQDILGLSATAKRQTRTAIERKLGSNPIEFGKPLRYSFRGARRLRVDDYRVIFKVEPPDVVLIIKIGHRRDVYKE